MDGKTKVCCLIVFLQMLSTINCQEIIKRVPQGFLGVRGKKYFESEGPDHFYKRKPQFFVGVKGKKSLFDYLRSNYEQYYKRAPMGFIGMRGKKESYELSEPRLQDSFEFVPKRGSLIGQIDYTSSNDDFTDAADFSILDHLIEEYKNQKQDLNPDSDEIKNSVSDENSLETDVHAAVLTKRAAHMKQFFGVRGKKAVNKRPFDMSFRGKFVGVRGKKAIRNAGLNEMKFFLDHEAPWAKRRGQMNGFFGMRGKKWTEGDYFHNFKKN